MMKTSNRTLRVVLSLALSVATSAVAFIAPVLIASGFMQERLRVASVGAETLPTRSLFLTGTVTRSGNDATYTPTVLNAAHLTSGELPTARIAEDVARTVSVTIETAAVLTLNSTP